MSPWWITAVSSVTHKSWQQPEELVVLLCVCACAWLCMCSIWFVSQPNLIWFDNLCFCFFFLSFWLVLLRWKNGGLAWSGLAAVNDQIYGCLFVCHGFVVQISGLEPHDGSCNHRHIPMKRRLGVCSHILTACTNAHRKYKLAAIKFFIILLV